jgi:pimeloyl-ACP methyl ester carboxylesterase
MVLTRSVMVTTPEVLDYQVRQTPTGIDVFAVTADGPHLDGLAQRLRQALADIAHAGFAVLVYDHRFIGDSEGQPRQRIRPSEQLTDRLSAVAFARTLEGIDPDKIVVWGYSMSAGTALNAAATDPRIAGAILLCPLLDGRWRSNRCLRTQPRNAAWITNQAIKDILGNAVVPVAAHAGGHGVLTFPGELDGFQSITAPGSAWRNEVRAAPIPGYSAFRPLAHARNTHCPILIQAGQDINHGEGVTECLGARADALRHVDERGGHLRQQSTHANREDQREFEEAVVTLDEPFAGHAPLSR